MMLFRSLISITLTFLGCGYRPGTPLTKAAFEGNTAEVRRILDGGHKDFDDIQEALVAAARAGYAGAIPLLVASGADLERRSGINNWTPLQHAIHTNQQGGVAALLAAGSDPQSGLHMAAGYGQGAIIAALLSRGADPERVYSGRNALDVALSGAWDIDVWTAGACQTSAVRELLNGKPGLRPLQAAIPPNCPEIARLLAGSVMRK